MQVAAGYAGHYPDSASFRGALEAELARMERFLTTPVPGCARPRDATAPGR